MVIPQATKEKLSPWFTEEQMEGVELVIWQWLPFRARAMTFDSRILFKKGVFEIIPKGLSLLGHELYHVQQYRQMGFCKFLLTYVKDALRMWNKPWNTWPLEEPAYRLQYEIERQLS